MVSGSEFVRPPYGPERFGDVAYDSTGVGSLSSDSAIADLQIYTTGEYPTSDPSARSVASAHLVRDRQIAWLIGRSTLLADKGIGRLDDVVIDRNNSAVTFGILAFNKEIPTLNDKLAAVPWNVLTVNSDRGSLLVQATQAQLEQSAFARSDFPDLSNTTYAMAIYDRFNMGPYWQTFGYTGEAAQPDVKAGKRMRFDPKNILSVSGVVESLEIKRHEMAMGAKHRGYGMLTIKTDDGKSLSVHLAPGSYLDSKGFTLAQGDKVMLKGWNVERKGKSVFIASEVQKGDQILMLRDEQGVPQWKNKGMKKGM
jgi:hypothetical protein